jgi:hypothetical protein
MKKVINRKVYDTETASFVAEASYSYPGDFQYWEESLYRTTDGMYFLAGEGGPMSHYAKSIGNNTTSGSSKITPITLPAAIDWCEENDVEADIIINEFDLQ